MNNEEDYCKNEFLGEIAKCYFTEENDIWFYDEISGGLYRLNRKIYTVEILLTPMQIHQKGIFPILQIVKWENKIYLIPDNLSYDWLIYDIEMKQSSWISVFSKQLVIGNATRVGEKIYLIPEKTKQVAAIMNPETLNVQIIADNWYKKDVKEIWCWGFSTFEDAIFFPIIGTKEVYLLQGKELKVISLQIKYSIAAISLSKDGIWILPNEGSLVFLTDKSGKLIESIEIQTQQFESTAEQFTRIIASDRYVYLFPKYGGRIWFLGDNKKWDTIGNIKEPLFRPFYQKTRYVPYSGCYHDENKLFTLPLQYRFAEICPKEKSIEYKILQCNTSLMAQQYKTWVYWFIKQKGNLYQEWHKTSLRGFLGMLKIVNEMLF